MRPALFFGVVFMIVTGFGCSGNKTVALNEPGAGKPTASAARPVRASLVDARSNRELSVVMAEGVGASADEALSDAFRNAVRQTVGTYVDEETRVHQDAVISDRVLTYSDGIVKKYEEMGQRQENGLFRVKIKAVIERRSLIERLHAANITVREVEGLNLAAEVQMRREARANAAELLRAALEGLPNVLVTEVLRPTGRDYDETTATLSLHITLRADRDRYRRFQQRLTNVLDKISLSHDEVVMEGAAAASGHSYYLGSNPGFNNLDASRFRGGWKVWVVNAIDEQATRLRWKGYVVDGDPDTSLSSLAGTLSVRISCLDAEGQTITADKITIAGEPSQSGVEVPRLQAPPGFPPPNNGYLHFRWLEWVSAENSLFGPGDSRGPGSRRRGLEWVSTGNSLFGGRRGLVTPGSEIFIAPLALARDVKTQGFRYDTKQAHNRKIKLTEAELKRLKDIRCEVVFRPVSNPTSSR